MAVPMKKSEFRRALGEAIRGYRREMSYVSKPSEWAGLVIGATKAGFKVDTNGPRDEDKILVAIHQLAYAQPGTYLEFLELEAIFEEAFEYYQEQMANGQ